MSISPNLALAAIPAFRIASDSLRNAFNTGVQFASHLAGDRPSSKANAADTDVGQVEAEIATKPLDELLQPLQQFLKSLGADAAVEIQTDSQRQISIDGEPPLKEAVEDWLVDHPEWTHAWHAAAQEFIAKLPSHPTSPFQQPAKLAAPSLRSQVRAEAIQHWYRTS